MHVSRFLEIKSSSHIMIMNNDFYSLKVCIILGMQYKLNGKRN